MARKNKSKNRKVETTRNVAVKGETYNTRKTVSIVRDGNCLFRALSYGLYKTQENHKNIRGEIVREITNNWETYKDYIIGDTAYDSTIGSVSDYQACMGRSSEFGGHQELQAFVSVHTQVYVEIHSSDGLLACYGNLVTCKTKFSLYFTGDFDYGHYDFLLEPSEIVDSDENDYDDYLYEVEKLKGWTKKNRW